ncbi:hypothetical protein ACWGMO_23605, partial [Nocardia salmonicida]
RGKRRGKREGEEKEKERRSGETEGAVRVNSDAVLRAYHGLRQVCGAPVDDTPGFGTPSGE